MLQSELENCISVTKENWGQPICRLVGGMGDLKEWGDPHNEADDLEMGG